VDAEEVGEDGGGRVGGERGEGSVAGRPGADAVAVELVVEAVEVKHLACGARLLGSSLVRLPGWDHR
jgi:hypothetical protein